MILEGTLDEAIAPGLRQALPRLPAFPDDGGRC
jgi:hypothetical protein